MIADPSFDDPTFQMLSRLGRRLGHELNNPLSAIASSVYLIKDVMESGNGHAPASEIEPFVTSIQEECDAMKATIEEYVRFVTTTSILKNKIDLSEFIQKRAEEMARQELPVIAAVPAEKIFAEVDAGGLGFVLRTLADSAIQAGATNVSFTLQANKECTIVFVDNRKSILSRDELTSLFSTEDHSQERPAARIQGLGLKLPLAKRIVELHGGNLEIQEPKANLTQICIHLPRMEPA